ncbi:hypothetical protein P171DRAFT_485840 [Karstenula rhodostoma CBS 690.94]|uniref:Helicase C-terminal domain-containing protein n=1 Tax=Karstenula rhodostoma CBS 690.94 TaxID=1392251 RepID=A0A9P4PG04_9PLEO|nr:hypothetical protein P171DRAFT_485840 [Karstenula rhodostoma CBS 690.94]
MAHFVLQRDFDSAIVPGSRNTISQSIPPKYHYTIERVFAPSDERTYNNQFARWSKRMFTTHKSSTSQNVPTVNARAQKTIQLIKFCPFLGHLHIEVDAEKRPKDSVYRHGDDRLDAKYNPDRESWFFDQSPESARLKRALDLWRPNCKAIYFSPFFRTNDLMEMLLMHHMTELKSKASVFMIDGQKIPRIQDRQAVLDDFARAANGSVLIATTKVLQEGLDITCATHVVFNGVTWSPINELQALSRAWRYGQKNPVDVEFLKSKDSIIDKRLWEIRSRKEYYEYMVVDGSKKTSTSGKMPTYDAPIARRDVWPKHDPAHPDPKRSYFDSRGRNLFAALPGTEVGLPSHDVFCDATSYGCFQVGDSHPWEGRGGAVPIGEIGMSDIR